MKAIHNWGFLFCIFLVLFYGCSVFPKPNQLYAPVPIQGNGGEIMCPYTQDDTIAEWVDTGMAASAGAAIGGAIGREAGSRAIKSIPIIGSIFGGSVGEAAGRAIAVEACGGWDSIKECTDLSFNEYDDLAVWLYVTKSNREDYGDVFKLTGNIYPKFKKNYHKYIKKRYKKQTKEK